MDQELAARFDALDRRFDGVDRRFDGVDQRFDHERELVGRHFEALEKEAWKRHQLLLEVLAERFEDQNRRFNEKWEQIEQRSEAMERRFDQKWEQVGRHFEALEKAALERHHGLLDVLHTRFDNHERRIRKLEGRG